MFYITLYVIVNYINDNSVQYFNDFNNNSGHNTTTKILILIIIKSPPARHTDIGGGSALGTPNHPKPFFYYVVSS